MVTVGSVGTYYLATASLKPVRRLSRAVTSIDAGSLDKRLSVNGPADEVKHLADAFDQMLDRLNRAFLQQSRFVANAAHELRTPLASMRTNLEVVHTDEEATLSDYQEMASMLDQVPARMEHLVNNLLLLARHEHEKANDEVSLLPLLEEVVATLSTKAAKYQVDLHLNGETDIAVTGDAVLLALVFSNLIENGLRYNRPGGLVEVTVREEADWAVITVADTGVGIPLEEQGEIFERFRRLDTSHARDGERAGLGLLFSVVATAVVLIVAVLVATSPSMADDPGPAVTVEKREVPEGTITEITEVIDSPAAESGVTSTLVYTNVIEVPEGIIVEQVEVINPSADLSVSGSEPTGSADFLPIEVEIDADGVPSFDLD